MTIRAALSIACSLMFLAFLSYYFAQSSKNTLLDEDSLSKLPDAIVTNLTVIQFNAQGQMINKLITPELTHIPKNDVHWFVKPKIQLQKENNTYWDISAHQAKAIHGFEKITLMHHVVAKQSDQNHVQTTMFSTEKLFYFPNQQLAISHVPVLFEQAGNQLASTGMKAWLGQERIQLLSKTHAIYQPKHASS